MEPTDTAVPDPGSIAGVAARLFLWGRRAPHGLARVEFDSDFSRLKVDERVAASCVEAGIPFHSVSLPQFTPAAQVVTWLMDTLRPLPHGIVSITGWATAFPTDVPLLDSLRVLNYNRENLAQFDLCQVWWLTRPLAGTFLREIPDLNSWFILRLSLDENIVKPVEKVETVHDQTILDEIQESARRQATDLTGRFNKTFNDERRLVDLVKLASAVASTLDAAGLKSESKTLAVSCLDRIMFVVSPTTTIDSENVDTLIERMTSEDTLLTNQGAIPYLIADSALLFETADQSKSAERLYLKAIEYAKKVFGSNNIFPYHFFHYLPDFYVKHERYSEAEALYQAEIVDLEKFSSPNLVLLANLYAGLAEALTYQENFAKAEDALLKVLAIRKSIYGVFLTDLVATYREMATFYRSLGRYAEEEMYEKQADDLLVSSDVNIAAS